MSPYRKIDIDLRKEGLANLTEGYFALVVDKDKARSEKHLLQALDYLVDAFLEDRAGNADLFAICHKAGAVVEQEFGCWFKKDDQGRYFLPCPILGLHSRVGFSPAFVTRGHCSICGAGDFDCFHVHGRVYDGVQCARIVDEMHLDHMSVTNDPDFAYTFRNQRYFTEAEIVEMVGQDIPPGAGPISNIAPAVTDETDLGRMISILRCGRVPARKVQRRMWRPQTLVRPLPPDRSVVMRSSGAHT